MERFKFKVYFSITKEIEAENVDEAKGIIKGMAIVQMPSFTLEAIDIVKPNIELG